MAKDRPEQGSAGHEASENLPPEIVDFLDSVVRNRLLNYDVLRFYYQNPYAILTAPDLTVWVSLQEKPLAEALQGLAERGYLTRSRASAAFVLTTDFGKRREIDRFFGYLLANPEVARRIRTRLRRQAEVE